MTRRNGQMLSVSRKTRTTPPPIRRAQEFRDQGCRFPGCTSQHCDAHHIVHWADGGETKLSNLVLLCRRHNRLKSSIAGDGAWSRVRRLHRSGSTPPESWSSTWRTPAS